MKVARPVRRGADGKVPIQQLVGSLPYVRLWPVSGGSACSTPGKCSGESYRRGLRGGGRV